MTQIYYGATPPIYYEPSNFADGKFTVYLRSANGADKALCECDHEKYAECITEALSHAVLVGARYAPQ